MKKKGGNNSSTKNNINYNTPIEKYEAFFNYAPISLWLEDFSKAKNYLDSITQNLHISNEQYLEENPEIIEKLASLVAIKDVNYKTLELFKAKSKKELFENLNLVFTKDSNIGFSTLLKKLLTGEKKAEIHTVNKTLLGEIINVKIKINAFDKKNDSLENVVVSIEDITENLTIQKSILESKNRYKETQSIAKISSWEYDYSSNKLYWSEEIYKMLEIEPNKKFNDLEYYLSFVHIEDRKNVQDFSIKKFLDTPIQQFQYRIITKNGTVKYISEKRSAIINNEGRIEKILGIGQDISERVLAEKKLNATKKLFSNTLKNIVDGFVILDYESNYLYVNQAAAKLLKKDADKLIGKNLWDEFPEKKGDLFYDKYHQATKKGEAVSFENYFTPWGKWFNNRIIPSKDGILIFFQEITQKKERENEIKKAYDIINKSASVAILCKAEHNFPVEFASENIKDLFGYSYKEFTNQNVFLHNCIYLDDIESFRTKIFELAKSKNSNGFVPDPFRVIAKDGSIKWVKTKVSAIRNYAGKITHLQGIVEDITELKKADNLLFESSQRLIDQFNNTPLASIMWNLDFKVIDWNNSAERIFGYKAEEAIGKHAKDLIIPKPIVNDIQSIWKTILKQTGGHTNTNNNITKNGEIITCDWYNVTLKDANGNITGVASLIEDITEKNKAKEALQKSESKYKDLFEKSHDPIMIVNEKGNYLDCNEAALKLYACTNKNEIVGKKTTFFSPEFQPNGELSGEVSNKAAKITLAKGSYKFEFQHKDKNGRIFPSEIHLTRIIDNDNRVKIHGIVRDISERKKKEKLEKVIYNISNAALTIDEFNEFGEFIKDELHKVIDTNNFFIALYNKENDTISTPFIIDEYNFTAKNLPAKGTLTGYVIKTKKPLKVNIEQHNKLIDQGKVDMVGSISKIWVGAPLKNQNNVFGAIAVQSYVNENAYSDSDVKLLEFVANQISSSIQIKNSQKELEEALLKAQESDRLKSAFLANMSHEIRTPMNGIIGFSELFTKQNITEKERQSYANIVIKSSKQLLSIVNDVLDISKIEAGLTQIHNNNVNVNELLDELYSFYKPTANEKNIEFILNKSLENLKSTIKTDRTKLKQVFDNLLSNAFKFTNTGSVKLGYNVKEKYLEFYIKDTGIGIEKELQPVIFDRFIQANIHKQQKGTGLGLAISKNFIELFGGEIHLESNQKGTTITFTIPYNPNKKIKKKIIRSSIEKEINVKNKELTILVAEDEEYNMMYINELFSTTKFKVIEAENGLLAVEKAKNNPNIDLILMDIKMPKLNGYEAMKEIKKQGIQIPIIALSAFAMESEKETAISKGFDSYLTKPINKELLFKIIDDFTK
ncbi:PAS domain S-box protein [Lutibacter sp. TH_r2]|uniref:PAS domain S-box protein n=1 Tax=Lutibacter sp. TH_r2 TaxID=3082083 RepID=UPI0029541C26|nr:PAS domain S-box protein [Lutibacter sp. TH_r2]MDV7186338.1 PAS domain S-box protein [Lutibacter sp. TH_r2]